MDRKKLVLLVGALIVAIGTALVARSMFAGAPAPEAQAAVVPTGPKVLVAQRALPVGTIITADSLGFQQWPEELVRDAYFIEGEADVSSLLGTVVRNPITAGEPVTQGSLVSPGDRGFLAAALTPGMRAVTVPVDARTGVAGFIFPGDRVDMVLTQEVDGAVGQALKASETIIRNLRVLATDQATDQETVEGKTVVRASNTVTLEVTPKIAEKIAVAQTIGTLSFTLRSLADNSTDLERALAAGNLVIPDNATPEQEEKLLRDAMARPDDGRSTYSTGADVSRFQRSTMPPQTAPQPAAAPASQPVQGTVSAPAGAPARSGPAVRVTRGKNTEEVPVDKVTASNLSRTQSRNVGQAAPTVSAAAATIIR